MYNFVHDYNEISMLKDKSESDRNAAFETVLILMVESSIH
jgi:hypothetical protein